MKKLCAVFLLVFLSLGVFAYDDNNSIYVGFETESYKYEEPHMDHTMSLKGRKIGASLEWIGKRFLESAGLMDEGDRTFATFEARFMTGDTQYNGYLQSIGPDPSGVQPYIVTYTPFQVNNVPDWYLEGRITLGQTYNFMDVGEIWPYIGFGYRRLVNNMEKEDPNAGYKRTSQYYYIPIGFRLKRDFDSGFKISLISEFDLLIHGEQTSHLGDIIAQMYPGVETNNVYNYQRRGWGARFSLKVEVPVSARTGLFVEPYFRMWKIQNSGLGESDVIYMGGGVYMYWYNMPFIEPFNVTKELGIKAGFYF